LNEACAPDALFCRLLGFSRFASGCPVGQRRPRFAASAVRFVFFLYLLICSFVSGAEAGVFVSVFFSRALPVPPVFWVSRIDLRSVFSLEKIDRPTQVN